MSIDFHALLRKERKRLKEINQNVKPVLPYPKRASSHLEDKIEEKNKNKNYIQQSIFNQITMEIKPKINLSQYKLHSSKIDGLYYIPGTLNESMYIYYIH